MSNLTNPCLPDFSWLALMTKQDRELLSSYGEFLPCHPGKVLIENGEPTTSDLYVIISGEMEVQIPQSDGSLLTVATVTEGDTLGEVSLFDPGVTSANIVASKFCQLWRIGANSLDQYMLDYPQAGNILLASLVRILCQRVRQRDPLAVSCCQKPISWPKSINKSGRLHT